MSQVLKTQLEKGLLKIVFHDPSSRNAFSLRAARELRPLLYKKDFDALIFTSADRVFCSGGNLSDYAAMPDADQGRRVNDEIRDVLGELATIDRPTLTAVNGDAFGGGVELLSCFDVVISSPHAMFALWQRKIGLSFGWGGGARLEKRVGSAKLRSLSLSANAIIAREAKDLGLIDEVVQESILMAAAEARAREMMAMPKEPIATFKNFSAATEPASFNKLWWNDTHRKILANRKR